MTDPKPATPDHEILVLQGRTATHETRAKMSASQKARFARENTEPKG